METLRGTRRGISLVQSHGHEGTRLPGGRRVDVRLADRNGIHRPLVVNDLSGAAKKYPLAAFALSVALLALGGLPPLSGFMSKWQIFVAGFQGSNPWLMGLVIFAALNSVLSLAYYAPIVNMLYRRNMGEVVQQGSSIPFAMNIPLVVFTLAIIIIGLMPSLMNWLTRPAAQALLTMFGK